MHAMKANNTAHGQSIHLSQCLHFFAEIGTMQVVLMLLLTFAGAHVCATYPAAPNKAHTMQSLADDPKAQWIDGTVLPPHTPAEAALADQHPHPKHLANNVRRARYNTDVKHTFVFPPSSPPDNVPTSHPTTKPTRSPTKAPSTQPTRQPTKRASPITHPTRKPIRSPTKQPTRQPTKQPTIAPTEQRLCPRGIRLRLGNFQC
jgi:hypothetical protein